MWTIASASYYAPLDFGPQASCLSWKSPPKLPDLPLLLDLFHLHEIGSSGDPRMSVPGHMLLQAVLLKIPTGYIVSVTELGVSGGWVLEYRVYKVLRKEVEKEGEGDSEGEDSEEGEYEDYEGEDCEGEDSEEDEYEDYEGENCEGEDSEEDEYEDSEDSEDDEEDMDDVVDDDAENDADGEDDGDMDEEDEEHDLDQDEDYESVTVDDYADINEDDYVILEGVSFGVTLADLASP
ncbi:hypothetical protein BDZ91DRAFT_798596 [Kalaharituber pfeilii]|nr:hypothetical protein BDZ91DRAFT_798596 [Kalaharituber pfeilii]